MSDDTAPTIDVTGPGTEAPCVAPKSLGRYRIEKALGAGAMGVVYLAEDPELERKVAIKLLMPSLNSEESQRAQRRMRREAKLMARLEHPNIVRVYEVGLVDDQVFVVMEYIEGLTLDVWLAETPRTWVEIAAVFLQAGEGLLAAHEVGIVHRDFKPRNVMIEPDRSTSQFVRARARVLDFGIAGMSSEGVELDVSTSKPLQRLTMTGAVLGTPAYMSPEQFQGQDCGYHSDQFSYCVAFYEALFGERPFAGETFAERREAVLAGEMRAPPAGTDTPRWLSQLVMRGLALEPGQRWPTHRDMLVELGSRLDEIIREERGLTITAERRTRSIVAGIFAALLSILTIIALFTYDPNERIDAESVSLYIVGTITVVCVPLALALRMLTHSIHNRRAAMLFVAIVLGIGLILLNTAVEGLSARESERFILVMMMSTTMLGGVAVARGLFVVTGISIVTFFVSLYWQIAGMLGVSIGVTLVGIFIALAGGAQRKSGPRRRPKASTKPDEKSTLKDPPRSEGAL